MAADIRIRGRFYGQGARSGLIRAKLDEKISKPMKIQFEDLWRYVVAQIHVSERSVHGPDHWRRVERNGLVLSERTGADVTVVRLFALFHDSCRVNDCWDDGHGARGAEFARSLRGSFFDLPDDQFELLHHACTWHTDEVHHSDPTIGTCWDADRLDLGRVGAIPDAHFMSTSFGREIADFGSIQPFVSGNREANRLT